MTPESVDSILDWMALAGLGGADEATLMREFSRRCIAAGFPLTRGVVFIDTLHPLYEGRVLMWEGDPDKNLRETDFQPVTSQENGWENWEKSPFFHMLRDNLTFMRCRLSEGDTRGYTPLEELRDAGQTDYVAVVHRLRDAPAMEDVDGFYSRWTTDRQTGFTDAEVEALKRLTTHLALAIRHAAQTRLAETLVQTYLGRDPGRRILQGGITRGKVEKINAVLWFSDLSGYTRLSEEISSDHLIPLLNDYAGAVIDSIHEAGGDVLKLIGDGVLAIFAGAKPPDACLASVRAARALRQRLTVLAEERRAAGKPIARVHLGMHVGDVFYGNIGSADRLDFTVVGQAVNEVSRIAAMCHSVEQPVLFSSEFVETMPEDHRERFVSVGRFALRGVGHAQHLFTIDPALQKAFAY